MEFKTREFVFLLVLGVLISSLGFYSFLRDRSPSVDGLETQQYQIAVHVSGHVHNPGVYSLDGDSRVIDAIKAAGGELPEADLHRLNLAAFLTDGQKINVPGIPNPADSGIDNGLVNINTADQKTLETLPNIGPARAQRIIEYREANGGFASIEEIINVSSIGEKIYESIKDYITH